jgi:hypothetical protein
MVRKTRKHSSSKHKKEKGIYSIPELRRSFDHIEHFVDEKLDAHESKEAIVKDLRKEWTRVFLKELDKKSAEAFVEARSMKRKSSKHRTIRRMGGAALSGAPVSFVPNQPTQQGLYLAPGQIPDKAGHLPLSDGGKSSFGSFVQYVSKGFWNPEPGQSYDPIIGQTRFPTTTPLGMGTNTVHFKTSGGKRKTRRIRRGGGNGMTQATNPPNIIQDLNDMFKGKTVGPSPDQVQRLPNYQYNNKYPSSSV